MDRCSQCGTTEHVGHFITPAGRPEIALCCSCYKKSEYFRPECATECA